MAGYVASQQQHFAAAEVSPSDRHAGWKGTQQHAKQFSSAAGPERGSCVVPDLVRDS
jgi:hypothetical protein